MNGRTGGVCVYLVIPLLLEDFVVDCKEFIVSIYNFYTDRTSVLFSMLAGLSVSGWM